MSNVVIIDRGILNQTVKSVENSRVLLPFNVTKEHITKVKTLLSKVKATFSLEMGSLKIDSLTYGNINFNSNNRTLPTSNFTLSKTYVATMKQSVVKKVKSFYDRVLDIKEQIPVFDISNETNLQEALQEATNEIDLSALKMANVDNEVTPIESPVDNYSQVLVNNPSGEDLVFGGELNANKEIKETNIETNTNNDVEQENIPLSAQKPKVRTRSRGNVLVIPIVIAWLAFVLIGTIKLVTNILG